LDLSDDVRFSLESDRLTDIPDWQLRANNGLVAVASNERGRIGSSQW